MVNQHPIHPVILCGGSGTRLWPVSRRASPKPFLRLVGDTTLFEQAIFRVQGDDHFHAPLIVAGSDHQELIAAQMHGAQHRLIVEPAARNTAPAIALAAALLDADAIMLVCPSDHHIADNDAFGRAAFAAAELAASDYLVSIAIAPDRPETGYGYIRHGTRIAGGFEIASFVEKPDAERAKSYLDSGEYSWNAGIFAFRAGALLNELAIHRPAMAEAVIASVAQGRNEGALFHPDAECFEAIEADSIDYAVMENTSRAAMVPADMGWSDIGNWAALHDALTTKTDENVVRGTADLVDCQRVLASSDGPRVSAIGLEDICIIVANDEVLVTTRDGAQAVGKLPGAKAQ